MVGRKACMCERGALRGQLCVRGNRVHILHTIYALQKEAERRAFGAD